MNLSPTMMRVAEQMESHGELIRYPGGFWSWRDVEIKNEIPAWYCDVKTLRALRKRGIVNLNETKKICKLNRCLKEKNNYENKNHNAYAHNSKSGSRAGI